MSDLFIYLFYVCLEHIQSVGMFKINLRIFICKQNE